MICNQKLLLSLLIIIFTSSLNICYADIQKGGLEYNAVRFNYSALNVEELIVEGNSYFDEAIQETRKYYKNSAFDTAMGKYYLVMKADPKNCYVLTKIARIYSYKNQDKLALQYFSTVMNIQPDNPEANYHLGEFYYKKQDYNKALNHYIKAYNSTTDRATSVKAVSRSSTNAGSGYSKNYDLNYRLGIIYEKLADIQKAKSYYDTALSLNNEDKVLQSKIKNIERLDYGKSDYYHGVK